MSLILQKVERDTGDAALIPSVHFSPTILTFVRRLVAGGGTIVTDTMLSMTGLDKRLLAQLGLEARCFIDDAQVVAYAEKLRVTRAEIAVDHAMALPGMKLFVVGSAPMALQRLLVRHKSTPLHDVAILAAPTGYASVVQLKERVWDSDLPVIVARGRKGGTAAAVAIVNALLSETTIANK